MVWNKHIFYFFSHLFTFKMDVTILPMIFGKKKTKKNITPLSLYNNNMKCKVRNMDLNISISTGYRSFLLAATWELQHTASQKCANLASDEILFMIKCCLKCKLSLSVPLFPDDEQSFLPPRRHPHRCCSQSGWRLGSLDKWGESLITYQPIGATL